MPLTQAKIKLYRSLHQKKGRKASHLFIVEGPDLVKEALRENWPLKEIYLTHYFGNEVQAGRETVKLADLAEVPCDFCSQKDMNRITDAQTPQGAIALAEHHTEEVIGESEVTELLLICEQISDPGNLGTLIRTADWFGVQKIILGTGSVDPYSPKVVRSSAGSIFRVTIEATEALSERLHQEIEKDRKLFAASLSGNLSHLKLPKQGPRGLVLGHERKGVSEEISRICTDTVRIESRGRAESLNLAVAAGILLQALCN
jgi:TrmH family RNA methyltransferase